MAGSYYVQTEELIWEAFALAVPVGLLAAAILVVNNVRDRDTDVVANKRTLAVRFGTRAGQYEYLTLIVFAYLVPVFLLARADLGVPGMLPWLSLPWAIVLARRVFRDRGPLLNRSLVGTAKLLLLFGVLFTLGICLGAGDP